MWRFDRFGDAPALLDEHGQSLTYAQLAREGEALCGAIGGRCLCFNLCGNTLGSAVGYAGMVEGGVAPALLAASIDRELFQALYEAYHPAYLGSVRKRLRALRLPPAQNALWHGDEAA